ncbi:hypothetical protein Tco_0660645 [Tanacetum coccineum]
MEPKSLKNKSFANFQELFDKAMKMVNTFVDYRTELVEESSKKEEAEITYERSLNRAGEELKQESSKKQKLEEDKEFEELKQYLEIIPDDVTIDATPLSTKSPTIIDYKIYKEGKNNYFQILRFSDIYSLTNHTLHPMFNDVKLQVDYGVKWHFSFLDWSRNSLRKAMYLNEVFGSILLVIDETLNEI